MSDYGFCAVSFMNLHGEADMFGFPFLFTLIFVGMCYNRLEVCDGFKPFVAIYPLTLPETVAP